MPNKNSTLSYRWMQEVWNEGREAAIDEMMDANAEVHGIDDIKERGTPGFKQFFHSFRSQFPQLHVEVEDVVVQDDCETARCIVKATTSGGQQVQFTGMTFVRIHQGKIIEAWNNFDFMSMYKQLGYHMAVTEPAPL